MFFTLLFFPRFSKTLSYTKYEYAKIQRKILLEDALAMIWIDFCYVAHTAKCLTC